jgi:hypothetical protein
VRVLAGLCYADDVCCCCCCQVLFFTFSSMIGLMLATFYVVVNSGAVRLAGV